MGTTAGDADDAPYDDDVKRPLSDVTHKNEYLERNNNAHFEMNDNSPANSKQAAKKQASPFSHHFRFHDLQDTGDPQGHQD